jgi:hypothetical protein
MIDPIITAIVDSPLPHGPSFAHSRLDVDRSIVGVLLVCIRWICNIHTNRRAISWSASNDDSSVVAEFDKIHWCGTISVYLLFFGLLDNS